MESEIFQSILIICYVKVFLKFSPKRSVNFLNFSRNTRNTYHLIFLLFIYLFLWSRIYSRVQGNFNEQNTMATFSILDSGVRTRIIFYYSYKKLKTVEKHTLVVINNNKDYTFLATKRN